MSETVLVLGATSAIALAYCRRLAGAGAAFVLVGRNGERLSTIAADLKARGASEAVPVKSDLADMSSCERRFLDFCARLAMPDQVLIAYGTLGDQPAAEDDAEAARAIIDVNFTSAALWLQMAAKHLARDRPRSIIVISSVAGDRGRRSNYVYGAAKAGLTAFAEGLAHRLYGTNLHVLNVKPGFVDTPMTAHLDTQRSALGEPGRDCCRHRASRAAKKGRGLHPALLVADHDHHPAIAAPDLLPDQALTERSDRSSLPSRGRVVVTGAAGLVGQNLVPRLKARGFADIVGIDKHAANSAIFHKLHPDVRLIEADLALDDGWQDALAGADALVSAHAQIGGVDPDSRTRYAQACGAGRNELWALCRRAAADQLSDRGRHRLDRLIGAGISLGGQAPVIGRDVRQVPTSGGRVLLPLANRQWPRRRCRVILLILSEDRLEGFFRPKFRAADLRQAGGVPI